MMSDISEKTLCLVDGSGYIFRAFYALPSMKRPDGTPTNAVYGFTNMMMNLIHENVCSHIVVVFDAKRQNFRNDIYPDYKANRKETPEELAPQFPLIRKACDALNVPWLEMEGYEADDLIATYANLATQKGWKATVISADKDLMQLMSESVNLYDPMKKKMLTSEDVFNKFGVSPDKVVDVQSLTGDSTDNIPGATGIGPKTAAELIQKFGSLHNLLNHLDEIPQEKRREGLLRDKDQILMSEKLVQLDKNAPVKDDFSIYAARPYDSKVLIDFLTQNNFPSLIKKVKTTTAVTTAEPKATISTNYQCVQEISQLNNWLKDVSQILAITSLTDPAHPDTLLGLALAKKMGEAIYIPLNHTNDATIPSSDLFATSNRPTQLTIAQLSKSLTPILTNTSVTKIGHNIKSLWRMFNTAQLNSEPFTPFADTRLMAYDLIGPNKGLELPDLTQEYLHQTLPIWEHKEKPLAEAPLNEVTTYAAVHADMTLRLYQTLSNIIKQDKSFEIYHDIDAPLLPILFQMEKKGILVDIPKLKQLEKRFTERLDALTKTIHEIAGEEFNINSPAQLGVILYEKRGLSGGKRGSNGKWITDAKALENLAEQNDPLVKEVLQYRATTKLKSTYVDALLEHAATDPRIHTTFSVTNTNTGRLASSDPNLQNIPVRTDEGKEIRGVFVAKPGYKILAADYSQIELRLMAEVANVTKLKQSFLDGEDIHARTASQILNIPLNEITPDQRRQAKAINFGIIYGISAFGLANNIGVSRGEAKAYIDTYFAQYPEIKEYMNRTEKFAEDNGFVLTPFGRKIYISGLDNRATKSFALRAAINAPIQGGAADIIKMAMIRVNQTLSKSNLDATLLLQVHDELVFEVAEKDVSATAELVKKAMEQVVKLSIPLIVDVGIGDDWKQAH